MLARAATVVVWKEGGSFFGGGGANWKKWDRGIFMNDGGVCVLWGGCEAAVAELFDSAVPAARLSHRANSDSNERKPAAEG